MKSVMSQLRAYSTQVPGSHTLIFMDLSELVIPTKFPCYMAEQTTITLLKQIFSSFSFHERLNGQNFLPVTFMSKEHILLFV